MVCGRYGARPLQEDGRYGARPLQEDGRYGAQSCPGF
jgi:hypothetical protein